MKKFKVSFCITVILTMVITSLGFMSFDGINNYLYAEAGDETSISVRASAYEKDENGGRKEPEALKGAKAFWYKLSGRELSLAKSSDKDELKVTVEGKLPEDVTAEAKFMAFDEDKVYEAGDEAALFALELRLKDKDGNNYVPEEPVTVRIAGDRIRTAAKAEDSMLVYSYEENDKRAEALRKSSESREDIYAADVLVYRHKGDKTDKTDKSDKNDKNAERKDDLSMHYTYDKDGFTLTDKNEVEFEYKYGHSLDAKADGDADYADAALIMLTAQKEQQSDEKGRNAGADKADNDANAAVNDSSQDAAADGTKTDETGKNDETKKTEDTDKSEDKTAPAESTISATDGRFYKINVSYDEASGIPADAKLEVKMFKAGSRSYDNYVDKAADALDSSADELAFAHAFDISLVDPKTGAHYQPDNNVKVSIELLRDKALEGEEIGVVHFRENALQKLLGIGTGRAEVMDTGSTDSTVEFESDSFSVFVVAGYTVDFHWGDYTFNMEGGTTILLSELLENLVDIADGDKGGYDTAALKEMIKHPELIKSVKFSNPDFVQVEQATIVSDKKAKEDFKTDEEEQDELDRLEKEGSKEWMLISLKPFDSDETLTIKLTDGRKVVIPVTDAVVDGSPTSNSRRVTADGVTYTLSNGGTADGTAEVYAITDGCTIHDGIKYKGHLYQVKEIDQSESNLTRKTSKMDWELILRAAGKEIELPEIRTDLTEAQQAEVAGFVAGDDNSSKPEKVWKKAELNGNTLTYTLKYFQAMEDEAKMDFIFVYDDSASMYSGHRTSNNVVLREAQTTRVMILDAAHALLDENRDEGYKFKVYLVGASTGDTRTSNALETYTDVENYLASYHTGTTRHATGVEHALSVAQASKNAGRDPVVIYLSDFHQAGTLGTAGINNANALHEIAPVYGLSTDLTPAGNAYRHIPTSTSEPYFRTMTELSDGIQALQDIIWDAIGYYQKDDVTVTDNLSDALAGQSTTNTTAAGNGTVSAQKGRTVWSVGNQNPLLKAGELYTETFTTTLDENKVYSGDMPTNKNVSVKKDGTEVNGIAAAESPRLESGVKFTLGKLKADGTQTDTKLANVSFTLKDGDTQIWSGSTSASEGSLGQFEIPYKVNGTVVFQKGRSLTLTETSTPAGVSIANPMTWTLKVNNDYTISASKANADTDITISNSQFQIWNKEETVPELVKIQVKKVWDIPSDIPDAQKAKLMQEVKFQVYGIRANDTSKKIEIPAYAENDDNTPEARKNNKQVGSLKGESPETVTTDDDGNTVWSREVWVPKKIVRDGTTIEFDTTQPYTITEAKLIDPEDDPEDEIIGAPGSWEDAQSEYTKGGVIEGYVPVQNPSRTNYLELSFQSRTTINNLQQIQFVYGGTSYRTTITFPLNYSISNSAYSSINVYIPFRRQGGYKVANTTKAYFTINNTVYEMNYNSYTRGLKIDDYITSLPSDIRDDDILVPASTAVSSNEEWKSYISDPSLTLTNTFDKKNVVTIKSNFTDTSRDADASNKIKKVKYTVTDSSGKEIETPEVDVNDKTGAELKLYVPKDQVYTVKQAYYKYNDGTVITDLKKVNAADGLFNAYKTSYTKGTSGSTEGGTAVWTEATDKTGTLTFTNDRKKLPVIVKAAWDPELADDDPVNTRGIPYEIRWSDGQNDKLGNQSVKKADQEAGSAWSRKYQNIQGGDIPTYNIKGELTNCDITGTSDPHEDYITEVKKKLDEANSTLEFTIENKIKKGDITISKDWDVDQFDENASGTGDPQMKPDLPGSVTVCLTKANGQSFSWTEIEDGEEVKKSGTELVVVLNSANKWKYRVTGLDIRSEYYLTETKIGSEDVSVTPYAQTYNVTEFDSEGHEVPKEPASDNATVGPDNFGVDGAVVDITNTMHPIARVKVDNGEWQYFEYLITTGGKTGALSYASDHGGTIIIETLKNGFDGTDDDTKYGDETVGRYTLSSGVTFNKNADITIRSVASLGAASVITRDTDFTNASLITIEGACKSFRTENITFDGAEVATTIVGGIINDSAGALVVGEGTTMRNSIANSGGAVYATKALTVQGKSDNPAIFENCSCNTLGGAIYATADLSIEECVFRSCTAAATGGGLYQAGSNQDDSNASLSMTNTTFTSCKTTGGAGGGLQTSAKAVTATGCNFTSCEAKTNGGGMNVYRSNADNSTVTITNCKFDTCKANGGAGGGLRSLAASTTVTGGQNVSGKLVAFNGCTATSNGAGIYTQSGPLILDGCTIQNCSATSDSSLGGGVYANHNVTLKNGVLITKNKVKSGVESGGGMYIANGRTLILGASDIESETSRITGNSTTNSNSPSDVRISEDTTKWDNAANSVDIKCHLGDNCLIKVANAKYYQTVFGTTADTTDSTFNLNGISVSQRKIVSDDGYLYAVYVDGNPSKIMWYGVIICKATSDDNTLLKLPNGADAIFTSVKAAFDAAETDDNSKKLRKGTEIYSGSEFNIKMVVPYFETPESIDEKKSGNTYTLTTAGYDDTDGWPYKDKGLLKVYAEEYGWECTGDTFNYTYPDDQTPGISLIKRQYNSIFKNNLFTVKDKVTLNLENIIIDGNKDRVNSNDNGMINVRAGGTLNIKDGTELRNNKCSDKTGGAVCVYGTATMTGGSITGSESRYGGGVCIENGGLFTLSGGEISGNTSPNGGGVNVKNGTFRMSGGRITGNVATNNGGGVFIDSNVKAVMELSGSPDFGGQMIGADGKLNFNDAYGKLVANISRKSSNNDATMNANATNGGQQYPEVENGVRYGRQDIYIAGNSGEGAAREALRLTGSISAPEGSIWVWAEKDKHYKADKQFAVYTTESVPGGLDAFRNARDDKTISGDTLNNYLSGVTGENKYWIYWGVPEKGSRKVMIRKVNTAYTPVSGREFTLYKGSSSEAYKPPNESQTVKDKTSKASGVIWIGELPYGWYIIEETTPHKFFYLVVTAEGTYGTSESAGGYTTRDAAETKAKAVYSAHN